MWSAVLTVGAPISPATLEKHVRQQTRKSQTTKKHKSLKANSARPSTGLTARQKQITQALDKVRVKLDDPDINWSTFDMFKQVNEKMTKSAEQTLAAWNAISEKSQKLLEENSPDYEALGIHSYGQKRPDYAKETKGVPFIYLTDDSGHSTQSIVQEVKRVMKAVRQANPQARILLALEFAEMTNFTTPIRFAGKPNKDMDIFAPYDQLVPQANQLNMDILSLDDNMWWPIEEGDFKGQTATKVGSRLIIIPESPANLNSNEDLFSKYYGFLGASTAGMYLRNLQWISYLHAVKPFYDLVIVYAGSGHIDGLPFLNIPLHIGERHVIFNFYTLETNKRADEFAISTYQMLCDAHACVVEPQEEESTEGTELEWDGETVIYVEQDNVALATYVETLPEQTQRKLDAYERELSQIAQVNTEAPGPEATFTIYLPEANQ